MLFATISTEPQKQLSGVQSLAVIGCAVLLFVGGAIFVAGSYLIGTGRHAAATIALVQPQAEKLLANTRRRSTAGDDDLIASNSEAKPSERAFIAEVSKFEAKSGPLKSWVLTNVDKTTRIRGAVTTNLIRLRYSLSFAKGEAVAAFTFASDDPLHPETRISRCLFGADDESTFDTDNSSPVPK